MNDKYNCSCSCSKGCLITVLVVLGIIAAVWGLYEVWTWTR